MAVEHPLQSSSQSDQLTRETNGKAYGALEDRIGHRFADRSLLIQALTHESAVLGARGRALTLPEVLRSNERLEFLGDRVLGLVIAELLVERLPKEREGALTHRLIALVNRDTLAEIGRALGLAQLLRVGGGPGRAAADPNNPTLLGNAVEALIGAVYLDGGLCAARRAVERLWGERLALDRAPPRHPKQELQEQLAARGLPPPVYRVLARSGPDHAPHFKVAVAVEGLGVAEGEGGSKRLAEEQAAARMLEKVKAEEQR